MDFIERIFNLLDKKGISKNKMLSELKLSKNSFLNWSERNTTPSGEVIIKIANYFNVSTDYLLTGKETDQTQAYPENIQRIIDNLLKLNDEALAILYGETIAYSNSEKYIKDNKNKNVG